MKRRPRRIESQVAEFLSAFSTSKGLSPVKRIPVLGRTGPDIETNELGLVVDVKSRQSVPVMFFPFNSLPTLSLNNLLVTRLDGLDNLFDEVEPVASLLFPSIVVQRWWEHMDEWRKEFFPEGVSAIVLHRPGMHIQNAALVIHNSDRSKLHAKRTNFHN